MAIKTYKPLIFLFSITATIIVTQAQIVQLGRCPNVQTVQNFSIDAFSGTWYEHSRYPFFWQFFGKCSTVTFTPQPDGSIRVYNSQISPILENEYSLNGTAEEVGDGKLYATFDNLPDFGNGDYWILGTDYNSYAVAYSCQEDLLHFLFHGVQVWIITRERHPDNETIAAAENVIIARNLPLSPLHETDQTNCAN